MEGKPSYAEKGIKERGKLRDSLQALQANIPEHTKGCGTEACIHLITIVDWEPEKAQCLISTASESSSSHNSVTVLDGVQSQRMTVIDAGPCYWFALGYDIRYLCYWGALSANEWGSSNQLEIVFCAKGDSPEKFSTLGQKFLIRAGGCSSRSVLGYGEMLSVVVLPLNPIFRDC